MIYIRCSSGSAQVRIWQADTFLTGIDVGPCQLIDLEDIMATAVRASVSVGGMDCWLTVGVDRVRKSALHFLYTLTFVFHRAGALWWTKSDFNVVCPVWPSARAILQYGPVSPTKSALCCSSFLVYWGASAVSSREQDSLLVLTSDFSIEQLGHFELRQEHFSSTIGPLL